MGFLDKFKDIIRFDKLTGMSDSESTTPTPTTDSTDLTTLKVTELKAMAKEQGHKGYSTLKKTELIDLLNN
jgi:hypothetical protein